MKNLVEEKTLSKVYILTKIKILLNLNQLKVEDFFHLGNSNESELQKSIDLFLEGEISGLILKRLIQSLESYLWCFDI